MSSILLRSSRNIATLDARVCIRTALKSKPAYAIRPITCSTKLYKEDKRIHEKVMEDHDHSHAGSFSRTDNTVSIEYPGEDLEPTSLAIQGRGGMHFKRTLPSFSLEGRVGVVTGGARGLGLVMSQALVISGCDVAIVDLNSMYQSFNLLPVFILTGLLEDEGERQAKELMDHFSTENPGADPAKYVANSTRPAFACNYAHEYAGFPKSPPITPMSRIPTQSTPRLRRSSKAIAKSTIWLHQPASRRISMQSPTLLIESRNSGASTSTVPTCSQPVLPVT